MTLLLAFYSVRSTQLPRSRGVSVVQELVKRTTISEVETELNIGENIFDASYESNSLQDDQLKNYRLLRVSLPNLCAIEIHYDN